MKEIVLKVHKKYDIRELIVSLMSLGYEKTDKNISYGQFLVLGGNLSIFSINENNPVRIEFFGDQIDMIFSYDRNSGKKISSKLFLEIKPNILQLENKTKVKPGEFIVHEDHGIGMFSNLETKIINGNIEGYITIIYLNEDKFYMPVELKFKISSYVGVGKRRPRLSKLGSQTWKKTYHKVYDNILQMAKELLVLYATREIKNRSPWTISKEWESIIEKNFPYKKTSDQSETIIQIFNDLKKDIVMDRLICGDVGFGKTEVAIRAMVQACTNGFQVAFLVPTTILCEQHFVTFKNRFKSLPIKINHLNRFVSKTDSINILKEVKNGQLDIIVGTHALFNKNLKFKNLGLLVIDEEQKFGVKQKELIKQLKTNLNVLTLTATPIPRTLFMSLSGIRDISQINEPPEGRKEIKTEIKKYDDVIIKEYVERELARGGQVYFLHNKVQTIIATKSKLQKMFPRTKIGIVHGQMNENELAGNMAAFASGDIKILVCSTIIENGLDLPNVNTIIVEDSDRFGLSQLYQIRGRIGRSPVQAYALFTFTSKKITPSAIKRLEALVENTELGSGYSIALSDLEIRGGGNILGREQHGNMEAIGLVLYTKLLNKAVEKLKEKNNSDNSDK